jgi:hypothetical protein
MCLRFGHFLVCFDNTLTFARSQSYIEAVVQGLKNLGMDLEEDDVAVFLGVLFRKHPGNNSTIELRQTEGKHLFVLLSYNTRNRVYPYIIYQSISGKISLGLR